MAKRVVLDTRIFASRLAASEYFGAMLKGYGPGDRVSDAHAAELASLLQRHPESAEKIGCGIDYFEVQSADYSSQCFRVVRTDGTWARFSYHACVAPNVARG